MLVVNTCWTESEVCQIAASFYFISWCFKQRCAAGRLHQLGRINTQQAYCSRRKPFWKSCSKMETRGCQGSSHTKWLQSQYCVLPHHSTALHRQISSVWGLRVFRMKSIFYYVSNCLCLCTLAHLNISVNKNPINLWLFNVKRMLIILMK